MLSVTLKEVSKDDWFQIKKSIQKLCLTFQYALQQVMTVLNLCLVLTP